MLMKYWKEGEEYDPFKNECLSSNMGNQFVKEYACSFVKKDDKIEPCTNSDCKGFSRGDRYQCAQLMPADMLICPIYKPYTKKVTNHYMQSKLAGAQLQRELDELSPEVLKNIKHKEIIKMSLLDVVKHDVIKAQRGNAVIAIVKETLKAVPMSEELHAMIEKPGISDALIGIVACELYKTISGGNSKVREAMVDARTVGLFRLSESVTIVNDLIAKIGDAAGKIEMLAKSEDAVSEE